MIVVQVTVSSSAADPQLLLPVAILDPNVYLGAPLLLPGQEVVLFLEHVTSADAPGIARVADELWVIVSGAEGVFDVDGGLAVPRANPGRTLVEGGEALDSGVSVKALLDAAASD